MFFLEAIIARQPGFDQVLRVVDGLLRRDGRQGVRERQNHEQRQDAQRHQQRHALVAAIGVRIRSF